VLVGHHRINPHCRARAMARAFMAKDAAETCADVPSLSMGRAGRWTKVGKPSVAPPLAANRHRAGTSHARGRARRSHQGRIECLHWEDDLAGGGMDGVELQSEHDADFGTPGATLLTAAGANANPPEPSRAQQEREEEEARRAIDFREWHHADGSLGDRIHAVLAKMAAWRESAAVQEAGCLALKELAARHASARDDISTLGAEAVLRAMELHASNAQIQTDGCGVLRNVSAGNAQHQAHIVSLGGAQRVLDAMVRHAQHVAVQWAGCWALFCLTVHNPPLRAQVASLGSMHVVLWAMDAYPTCGDVQEAGCWALKELAVIGTVDILTWSHCVGAVSRASRDHPTDVVKTACRVALRTLASRDRDVKTQAVSRHTAAKIPRAAPTCNLTPIQE